LECDSKSLQLRLVHYRDAMGEKSQLVLE